MSGCDVKPLAETFARRLEATADHAERSKFSVCNLGVLKIDEARALAALLREAGDGWRPIESAPKDGTVVLLYCPQGDGSPGSTYRVTAGNWESDPGGITEHRDLEGRYLGQDESDGWEGWMSWDGGFSEDTMMPTHWRPLPAPPAAGGKDA